MSILRVVRFSLVWMVLAAAWQSQAQTEKILHKFTGGTDGSYPSALVLDNAGDIYGTTTSGGQLFAGDVFKITASGAYSIIYSFNGGADGAYPSGLAVDSKNNLYGTTSSGGVNSGGTIFEMTPAGAITTLRSFSCATDGCSPNATPTLDALGNIYGTNLGGGPKEHGTVFKLTPSGTFSVVYSFLGAADGEAPINGVTPDSAGNLYGVTAAGGTTRFGSLFKITPAGKKTVLHNFTPAGRDGFGPYGSMTVDKTGNVYGTTTMGGSIGLGVVFEVSSAGKETILYNFAGGADGIFPNGNIIFDSEGNMYSTTSFGGSSDLGTVFKLTSAGAESVLHSFTFGTKDGNTPNVNLTIDAAGNLYGTTPQGGSNNCGSGCGVAFKITN